MAVQQCAVHIEEHVIDLRPIEDVLSAGCRVLSHEKEYSGTAQEKTRQVVFMKNHVLRSDASCRVQNRIKNKNRPCP